MLISPRYTQWIVGLAFSILLSTSLQGQTVPLGQSAFGKSDPNGKTTELWFGVIKTPAVWLRTAVYLTRVDGQWTGHSISLDQKGARIPITKVTRENNDWSLEFKTVNGNFQGREADDHNSVEGNFTQNGQPLALRLERLQALPQLPASKVYRGELNAIVRKLSMQMRVLEGEQVDGKQLVLVDSLSEGYSSLVGTLEEIDGERIVRIQGLKAVWKGAIIDDDPVWKGTWTQGIIPLPLDWKLEAQPLDASSFQKKRPQTPKPPFPYEVRQVDWVNEAQPDVKLAGTLTLPASDHKLPAVILVSGSGPQDRDESIADHKPFWVIADYLSRHGFAVLRYDDRGTAASTGDFAAAATEDFVSDALSAWRFLATQAEIDPAKIGYLGHSEGSSVAISAAVQNEKISFLILMAGAGWDGQQIVVEQTLEMARRQGSSTKSLATLRKLMEQHSQLVLEQSDATEFATGVDTIVAEYLESEQLTDEQRTVTKVALGGRLKELNSNWYRDFLGRNPATAIPLLKIPVLAVWGSEDVQVPAVGNRDAMQAAFAKSRSHALTRLEIFPGLNHLLQPCTTGLIDEYESIETTIAPLVLESFTEFLRKVTAE